MGQGPTLICCGTSRSESTDYSLRSQSQLPNSGECHRQFQEANKAYLQPFAIDSSSLLDRFHRLPLRGLTCSSMDSNWKEVSLEQTPIGDLGKSLTYPPANSAVQIIMQVTTRRRRNSNPPVWTYSFSPTIKVALECTGQTDPQALEALSRMYD
jgi:hypothetical protein